ncbi:MAG: serine/threonine-protein kinase [Planctomycetota bacterium]|nr:serine/threonine-protein kinase [Planctomycetota bacterium]
MGIESYELGEPFMESGPSVFYRGQNAILGNEVMIRRLRIDPTREANVRETFFREQRLSATLRHPHVQRPIEVFEADGALWSVHEWEVGRLTTEIVADEGPFPLAEAARLGAQLADALGHMHGEGYVHGKVAPRFVILSERGEAQLINLVKAADLAADVWPLRPVVLGLSPFTAPEEFHGAKPTPESDLYGLAGTIFYWLTGRYPRGGADEDEALARAREGAPLEDLVALRPDVSTGLVERLTAALEVDPAERHGSVDAIGSLLVEIHQRHAAEIPSGFQTGAKLHPHGCCEGIEILGRHGAGAFGVVLRARDPVDGAILAIKALKPEHREDQNAQERFLREARALQQIDHTNVVGIRGVGEENGTPYAVMEFIDGPDLATVLLREGTLPPRRVAQIGAGIARGLAAIHTEGIIHRDLKPHNVLMAADDRPVIADFGVARQDNVTRLTMTGQLAGTPLYMAPEQFAGAEPTASVDLYALGTILFELLTGSVPFTGEDTLSTITAISTMAPPTLDPDVPEALRRTVVDLLAKRPMGRPATAEAVADVLDAVAAGATEEVQG